MTNLVELRVKAYSYMVNNFKTRVLAWFPPIDSDERMAATLAEELVLMAKREEPRLPQREIEAIKDMVTKSLEKESKSLLEAELEAIRHIADSLEKELNAIKEGRSDPSTRLVAAFKEFFGPILNEEEVDSYLVTPFSTRSLD